MSAALEQKGPDRLCFGGIVRRYGHYSEALKCQMLFSVFVPPQAKDGPVPVLYWLSGLTCNDENFITKAGAQRAAAQYGILLVCPDTSPRGCNIEGEEDSWDFGTGAGFYVDATVQKWSTNYRMYSYITEELPALVNQNLPAQPNNQAITGHSMGGHGALICALKNPGKYKAVSAFAPISNPVNCPWGVKAFSGYLGEDREAWKSWDAAELLKGYSAQPVAILVDQGTADTFLTDKQLLPETLTEAVAGKDNISLNVRMQEGYDHSYYFIATFIDDHLAFHAKHFSS